MLRAARGRFQSVVAGFVLGLGLVPAGETTEAIREPKGSFFALDRRELDGERAPSPSLFGGAFLPEKGASPPSFLVLSRDFFLVSRDGASPELEVGEAGAFAPTRFETGQKIEVPAGFCRTRQCKTLVVVGAAVAGGGVALIASGGEGNRKLGTALVLGGCGLIILVLLID